jgi:Zn-dependent M16 (insulinase) family peptidase
VTFYGDDDPYKRLQILDDYFKGFERASVDSRVPLQPIFHGPKKMVRTHATGEGKTSKSMVTVNWLLAENNEVERTLTLELLAHVLMGNSASALRKSLIESRLGESIAGGGLETDLRQLYFSIGLSGVNAQQADQVEGLILETLEDLARQGIDLDTIEGMINTFEFRLREDNTRNTPRGLSLMLRALTTWLHDGDPFSPLAYQAPLTAVKKRLKDHPSFLEKCIKRLFLENPHRTTLVLKPEHEQSTREDIRERTRLATIYAKMSLEKRREIFENTRLLRRFQESPDSPEAMDTLPALKLSDISPQNETIPLELFHEKETPILCHDLFTGEIVYLDLAFNLRTLRTEILPFVRLFGQALLEMGTENQDHVLLKQRINQKTGGIGTQSVISKVLDRSESTAWLVFRGKAILDRIPDLLHILGDVLFKTCLDNSERFKQIVLEEKTRFERQLSFSGHTFVNLRIRAHFTQADWIAESMRGISYIFFLRRLLETIDEDWTAVQGILEEIRRLLIHRNALFVNVTVDERGWNRFRPHLRGFLEQFSVTPVEMVPWGQEEFPECEGMTFPTLVNYVGKGANLYQLGFPFHGSMHVIGNYLKNTWLWDKVRVQGGAYGASSYFDRFCGTFSLVSYRDPNLLKTLQIFDESARFLWNLRLNEKELTRAIISFIADLDAPQSPDAKGFLSMMRFLAGETDTTLQQLRQEALSTSAADFRRFGEVLDAVNDHGIVKLLGSEEVIEGVAADKPGWLSIVKVL